MLKRHAACFVVICEIVREKILEKSLDPNAVKVSLEDMGITQAKILKHANERLLLPCAKEYKCRSSCVNSCLQGQCAAGHSRSLHPPEFGRIFTSLSKNVEVVNKLLPMLTKASGGYDPIRILLALLPEHRSGTVKLDA